MKNRSRAGLLMTIAIVLFSLAAQVGESFALDDSHSADQKKSVRDIKVESKDGEKARKSEVAIDSFEILLEDVLENNPELKFYEAEVLAAKGSRKTAGLWNNPEVNSFIGRKRVTSNADEGEDASGAGVASEIVVTQSIEWPGRIRLRKAIADRDIKIAELGLEQFRAVLKARVKVAAYVLSAAQEKAAATWEVADHFRALREVLIQRDQAGLTPLLETRVIETLELNMRRKASQASLDAKAALLDLNQLRGADPGDEIALTRVNLLFRPLENNENDLVQLAGSNDFQVRLRSIELERQGYELKLAKNQRFPAITAGPGILLEQAGDREQIIGAAISFPFPLWNRNQGNISTAKARQIQAETSFDIAQRNAARRVVEAVAIYKTKLKEMGNWKPNSAQRYKEAAELADRHYRLGSVSVSTYIDLQTQYLDTIEGLQQTKKEALETATQLELITGVDLALTQISTGDKQ